MVRAYVAVTGAVFGAIVVAHVARVWFEGVGMLHDPWWIGLTLLAAGLCGWAVVAFRRA